MINNINDLIKASDKFSMPDGKIETKEKGRLEFISKFPLASIQNFKIDDYCLGTSENSFCYWLEFKEILFGIGGGNASKFGIYKSKDGNYYEGYGPKKISLQSGVLDEKFSALKKAIIQGLDFVNKNEIEKIFTIQTPVWNMVLLKIFCLYYPDKFLTMGDPEVIIECAKNIGITGVELKNENSILINYLCRKKLNETTEFSNWNYEKIGTLIWQTFKETAKRDYYLIGSKYGENADKDVFPEMLKRSVVATGFASNLDLTELYNENHSVIKEFLQSHKEESNSINALKHFLSLKPGDLVAVKGDGSPKGTEGYLSIVGIAEVIEKNGKVYEYDSKGLGHIVNVKFLNAPILKELSLGGYGRTIHKLSNDEHIKLIFKSSNEMGYFEELNKFLAQAKTDDLGTTRNNYLQKYLGLEIKISFGQGGSAKIPWISFLGNGQTTSNGIYPVYLYFKAENLLVLAYGISVTNTPSKKWELKNPKTISEYFVENKLGTPFNYGNSFIFKTYNANQLPTSSVIDSDLNEILSYYNSLDLISNLKSTQKTISIVMNNLTTKLVSIKTKPFIILAGLSGTGKSRLVRTLAYQFNNIATDIAAGKNPPTNFQLVKVKPNWHDSSELLGYESRISGKDRFVATDFIRFIVKAWQHPNTPFFLCLDEMNLAPVEQYFAEYLSAIETRRMNGGKIKTDALISSKLITKYANKTNGVDTNYELWNELELTDTGIQDELKVNGIGLPSNLIVMGTVNMDETTHSFSRKVLDRAMTIEMNDINLSEGLSANTDDWNYPAEPLQKELVLSEKTQGTEVFAELNTTGGEIIAYLDLINTKLEGSPFKIAYRVRDEFLLYAFNYSLLENKPDDWKKNVLDEMTLMKILPRIEGDEDRTKLLDDLIILFQENNLPKSLNKATDMANRRRLSHYTSFWS